MVFSNKSHAMSHIETLCGKVFIATSYLEALKEHKENRYSVSKQDIEIRRCILRTQEGIARLNQEIEDVNQIYNELCNEVIGLS